MLMELLWHLLKNTPRKSLVFECVFQLTDSTLSIRGGIILAKGPNSIGYEENQALRMTFRDIGFSITKI